MCLDNIFIFFQLLFFFVSYFSLLSFKSPDQRQRKALGSFVLLSLAAPAAPYLVG